MELKARIRMLICLTSAWKCISDGFRYIMCIRIPCEIQSVVIVSVYIMVAVILVVVVVVKVLTWAAAVIGADVVIDT